MHIAAAQRRLGGWRKRGDRHRFVGNAAVHMEAGLAEILAKRRPLPSPAGQQQRAAARVQARANQLRQRRGITIGAEHIGESSLPGPRRGGVTHRQQWRGAGCEARQAVAAGNQDGLGAGRGDGGFEVDMHQGRNDGLVAGGADAIGGGLGFAPWAGDQDLHGRH